MPLNYLDSTDPRKVASNQRGLIQQRGDELNQQNQDLGNQAADKYSGYSGFLDPVTEDMAAGNGGYSEDERAGIMQSGGASDNYLTPQEQQAISGDAGSYDRYFNPEGMTGAQNDSAGLQRQTASNLQSRMDSSIDPEALKQSNDYRAQSGQTLANNRKGTWDTILSNAGNVRGSIDTEGQNVRGAIDPSAVTTSQKFLDDYNMSPEEKQNIIESAGISAGTGYRAATGEAQRRALAAGSSPMGVAAYRARMEHAAAGDAGDAMTKARVAASQEEAARKMQGEELRQQGGRYLTDTKVGSELNLGQQRAGAEQAMGSQAIGAEQKLGDQALAQGNAQEAQRLGAQQYLTGAQLHSAETGGEAALGTEGNINNQQRQQQQFNTTTGTGITQAQDVANSTRAGQVANNRQNINLTNQTNASNRTKAIGDTRVGQQNAGLGLVTQQAQTQNNNAQAAQGRQLQGYGLQAGATNQAAGITQDASKNPTTFDKVVGGIAGGLGAVAAKLDEGGIATKPTLAILGEHGPEMVMPVGGYRARRVGHIMPTKPKRFGHRMYGEVA